MNEPCYTRQLSAAALTACFAPVAVYCARLDVRWVALAGLAAWIYYLYIWYLAKRAPAGQSLAELTTRAFGKVPGQVLQGIVALWFFLLACFAAHQSAEAFPRSNGFPFIPVVLILLSCWAVGKGAAVVGRCCSVLFFFLAAAFAVVLAFGVTEVQWDYLRPAQPPVDGLAALAVMLIPTVVLQFRDCMRGPAATGLWSLGLIALAVCVSLVTVGSLGIRLAKTAEAPFYLVVEGISIFGVMERFEALISAALISSYFALICLFSLACAQNLKSLFQFQRVQPAARGVCAATLLGFWLAGRIGPEVLGAGTLLISGIIPAITLQVVEKGGREKKGK